MLNIIKTHLNPFSCWTTEPLYFNWIAKMEDSHISMLKANFEATPNHEECQRFLQMSYCYTLNWTFERERVKYLKCLLEISLHIISTSIFLAMASEKTTGGEAWENREQREEERANNWTVCERGKKEKLSRKKKWRNPLPHHCPRHLPKKTRNQYVKIAVPLPLALPYQSSSKNAVLMDEKTEATGLTWLLRGTFHLSNFSQIMYNGNPLFFQTKPSPNSRKQAIRHLK